MNKSAIVLLILSLAAGISSAQFLTTKSKITDVTVYRSMAKETRAITSQIETGNVEVVLTGISTQMIDQSLQVSVKGEATLLSATVRMNYFTETPAPVNDKEAERLRDSIRSMDINLGWLSEERSLYDGEINLIDALVRPSEEKESTKAADLSVKADFYRVRMMELKKKLFDLTLKQEALQARRDKFQFQLNEMGAKKSQPVKEIVLSFNSEKAEALQLRCGYLVNGTGWIPFYDIQVENTSKPVTLVYKAKIFQNTGYDWKDVAMVISSTNPNLENNRPLMSAHYIDYVQYAVNQQSLGSETNMMQMDRMSNMAYAAPVLEPAPLVVEIDPMEKDIQLDFELDLRQTIPSDGKEHICKLKTYEVPATYRYHAVPKLDPAAFLLARITDYAQYNLLKGDANVFYGETYVGTVLINPNIVSDTLLVSLGRDERIVVKRIRVQDKVTKSMFGGVHKDTYTWQTTIRNNKNIPIEIEVLDQIPLSRRKEIKVDLIDKCGAKYTEAFGKLMWNFTVKPSDTQKLNLVYTVEYPEGTTVQELQ